MNKPRVTELRVDGFDVGLFWVALNDLRPYGATREQAIKAFCNQQGYKHSGQVVFDDAEYIVVRPVARSN